MDVVSKYLEALEASDLESLLNLFADNATVNSPLYGVVPARDFYPKLFEDTQSSKLTFRKAFSSDGSALAFWFDFDWVLADGTSTPFTVVDVAELNKEGKITALHILYDTHPLRASFVKSTS